MDRDWHLAHPMPARATEAQRIAWHVEHAASCGCRPIPRPLLDRMAALGIASDRPAAEAPNAERPGAAPGAKDAGATRPTRS